MSSNGNLADDHATTLALSSEARQHPAAFAAAFDSGDPQALARVYEDGAVFVPRPGVDVTGEKRAAANTEFQALGLPITVRPRQASPTTSPS
ncbi:nuclear transport factor 2 family protein [Streptomyces sp. UNOB3_S3]|uniref:YybH family protein n=1 Tax=Streptomyces sp. UNOB3_S3 TaxID=2871682 RepID=UPI0027E35749|nr:nuclear transport factor 2 family protein [Streptomyces sp. UNOB3_S3]